MKRNEMIKIDMLHIFDEKWYKPLKVQDKVWRLLRPAD